MGRKGETGSRKRVWKLNRGQVDMLFHHREEAQSGLLSNNSNRKQKHNVKVK